ncbi:hypothetical protein C2E20_3593 [Micractinium conductrix]|uniref:Uncharacterized protein n=1 Tax=Micractinium conductrix TaxID=554055 RepID=A0A2P6VFV4_9CHLO|nr:hypothetical protein C2E20_3593 [Micractinium conductrix]|eukprot:PSC72976.1 hypothetical protein C2E20_3593 [Micractinium conductrix]
MAAFPSPPRRSRSQEALAAVEFMSGADGVVVQFSPCKPHMSISPRGRALRGGAAMLEALDAAAGGLARRDAPSPTGVAYLPHVAPSTASQPSSATSSLAAALADLSVSSRASSAGDLGDRAKLLASLGLPPPPAAAAAAQQRLGVRLHSRCPSEETLAVGGGGGGGGGSDAVQSMSPQLIGAVRSFDSFILNTLTPIKTRSPAKAPLQQHACESASPAAYPDSLLPSGVSPFNKAAAGGAKPKLQPMGRPVVYHSRGSSMAAPGAYNPYDMTAAALCSDFRSPAKSLHSPFPGSSRTVTPTPSQWGSAGTRASAYRAMAAQQALAPQAKEDEPDFYVSVPGMKRQQTLSRSISGISSLGGGATPAAPAAAAEAPSPAAPQPRPPSRVGSLERHPTLGSGTVVHGFKGLFRNIIVAGSTSNAGC